ncbi:NAD(P)-dependent oxidoreductase [Georgenia sp. Z1491]|uniref:NAD(P)-dependent oxidoreductase n=1 Tax=Georgenia sp. Z1491 TaxID=3416707 RepID=UPI003CF13250
MRIVVIGATGMVGTQLTSEATRRGHDVVAVSRSPGRTRTRSPRTTTDDDARRGTPVRTVALDVSRPGAADAVLAGADAAILAARAPSGAERRIGPLTTTVLDAARRTDTRLLVVGGAGPLSSPGRADPAPGDAEAVPTEGCPAPGDGGLLVVDDPRFVPPSWRAVAAASLDQLAACVVHPYEGWTYLSPPAVLAPGERSGRYRRGTTTLLTDPDGRSSISVEDLAVAAIDEVEVPGTDRHITVARSHTEHPRIDR